MVSSGCGFNDDAAWMASVATLMPPSVPFLKVVGQGIRLLLELPHTVHGLVMVVDGTRPHHHDQPVVSPMQHARDGRAAVLDQRDSTASGTGSGSGAMCLRRWRVRGAG